MSTVDLRLGDCLEILGSISTASIDVVIADPPYSINTKSDGQGKLNPWADRVNAAFWYREWIGQVRRVLKPSGCMWSFLNWRSMVTFQKASDDLCWPIESLLIWDKVWIGPGGSKGLRPSYEMVALWAGADFGIDDRGIPDIKKEKWTGNKPTGHPAEKPVELLEWLLKISATPNSIILDPFMGSGSTGLACIPGNHDFIGIELDAKWCSSAQRRIAEAQAQLLLELV